QDSVLTPKRLHLVHKPAITQNRPWKLSLYKGSQQTQTHNSKKKKIKTTENKIHRRRLQTNMKQQIQNSMKDIYRDCPQPNHQ
ncbi:unnamed protein product, partial [Brassica oleracea]